jgi:hypothetical protein
MVFNASFTNFSVISWQSVLLVEETGVPVANHRQTLSHNVVSSTSRLSAFLFGFLVNCKSVMKTIRITIIPSKE